MRQIKIFDTTLRDGQQGIGSNMTISEKIKIAKNLEEMGVDIIEAGFPISSKKEYESVKKISKIMKVDHKKNIKFVSDRIGKDLLYDLSSQKIIKYIGWKPKVDLKKGILNTINWIENNYKNLKRIKTNYKHIK